MPNMTATDFGDRIPSNADEILSRINNQILFHAESTFWSSSPEDQTEYESDLIRRYLAGDRSGDLSGMPDPIY